jgi:hypothetical protein
MFQRPVDDFEQSVHRDFDEVINKCSFRDYHIMDAEMTSDESLFQSICDEDGLVLDDNNRSHFQQNVHRRTSYESMISLITLSLGGVDDYSSIFESVYKDHRIDDSSHDVPTFIQFARKMAAEEGTKMDEKQYITYETIVCTFLLGLIEDGLDEKTDLGKMLAHTLTGYSEDRNKIIQELEARGGMKQLRMFLTGPAGAGKTTAVKLAEKFCFEFCKSVGNIWKERTFLFTAYTGSAASAFGGLTIVKAAYISKKLGTDLTDKEKAEWKHVRILIIDEISFMTTSEMKKIGYPIERMQGSYSTLRWYFYHIFRRFQTT